MSFELTDLELQNFNLTFWVESEQVEFGSYTLAEDAVTHEIKYDNKIRFHKPTQNKCLPNRFVVRSLAKVVDGVRGPIRAVGVDLETPLNSLQKVISKDLKCILDDPQSVLSETLIDLPGFKVRQVRNEAFLVTDKVNGLVHSEWGLQETDWAVYSSNVNSRIVARMHCDSQFRTFKNLMRGIIEIGLMDNRPESSVVLCDNETHRIVYFRVKDNPKSI